MYSLQTMLIAGGLLVAIGIVLGLVIGRTWAPPSPGRDLERRLKETQDELNRYQQSVAEHFVETSKRVGALTQTYRELHEHLAKGAVSLANAEIGRSVSDAGDKPARLEERKGDAQLEAPRDWAPRVPGTAGMLSEEFGLRDPGEPPRGAG